MKKVPLVLSAVAVMSLVAGASYWAGRTRAPEAASSVEMTSGKEKLPEKFRGRLEALTETASKLSSAFKVGISQVEFAERLRTLQGDFDLANNDWPVGQLEEEKRGFEELLATCKLLRLLWGEKHLGRANGFEKADVEALAAKYPGLDVDRTTFTSGVVISNTERNISALMDAISKTVEKLQQSIKPIL